VDDEDDAGFDGQVGKGERRTQELFALVLGLHVGLWLGREVIGRKETQFYFRH
jgi:hypothetical protein